MKEELQRRKEEVRLMIEEMEKMGRALATRKATLSFVSIDCFVKLFY